MRISDCSSDVCSSDLGHLDSEVAALEQAAAVGPFALFFTLTMAFAFFMLVFALGAAAAGGKRDSKEQRRGCDANGKFCHRFVRSEEHTSELQSLMRSSYAVFCLNK